MWKRTRFFLLILPLISSCFWRRQDVETLKTVFCLISLNIFIFLSNFQISKNFISLFSGTERLTKLKLGPHMDSRLMYHVYLNQAAGTYLFLYFFNFPSLEFQNIKFFVTFFCEAYKVELDTHMGKRLIHCVHQIHVQVARIYLFLYFSSFLCLSN